MSDRAASDKYPTGSPGKPYKDFNGNIITLHRLVKLEPAWARSRIIVGEEALLRVTELEDALKQVKKAFDQDTPTFSGLWNETMLQVDEALGEGK